MRLLLLSNSLNPGRRYLQHAREAIARHLDGASRDALLVPWAGVTVSWDDYHRRVADALAPIGVRVRSIHHARDPRRAVARSSAVIVGGGNTWQLLDLLQRHRVLGAIRAHARAGAPYLGWSAGSNVACPTIRTTNDMPIVAPGSLDALGLVPFQINPHYTEARLRRHGGETRVQRLLEFCVANPAMPVVALREGSWLEVADGAAVLRGPKRALVYLGGARRTVAPAEDVGVPLRSNG